MVRHRAGRYLLFGSCHAGVDARAHGWYLIHNETYVLSVYEGELANRDAAREGGMALLAAAAPSGHTSRTRNRVSRHLRMAVRMNMRKPMRMHVHYAYDEDRPDPQDAAGAATPRPSLRSPARGWLRGP